MEASTSSPTTASVFICKNGHRTVTLWSRPEVCAHRLNAHQICGLAVTSLADAAPDAKEKMLNPLKASKKAAKKK